MYTNVCVCEEISSFVFDQMNHSLKMRKKALLKADYQDMPACVHVCLPH